MPFLPMPEDRQTIMYVDRGRKVRQRSRSAMIAFVFLLLLLGLGFILGIIAVWDYLADPNF